MAYRFLKTRPNLYHRNHDYGSEVAAFEHPGIPDPPRLLLPEPLPRRGSASQISQRLFQLRVRWECCGVFLMSSSRISDCLSVYASLFVGAAVSQSESCLI